MNLQPVYISLFKLSAALILPAQRKKNKKNPPKFSLKTLKVHHQNISKYLYSWSISDLVKFKLKKLKKLMTTFSFSEHLFLYFPAVFGPINCYCIQCMYLRSNRYILISKLSLCSTLKLSFFKLHVSRNMFSG